MPKSHGTLWTLFIVVGLSGCATAASQGRTALSQGRYAEAAASFEQALSTDPRRADDLVGLGIARYKLGNLPEAEQALSAALDQAPDSAAARFYLGLSALRRGTLPEAEHHLEAFARQGQVPRLAAAVDRTLRTVRAAPVSDDVRAYMAASLEDQAEWARDLAELHRELQYSELRRLTDDRVIYVTRRCRC